MFLLYLLLNLFQIIKSLYTISIPFKVQNYEYEKKARYSNFINNYFFKDIKVDFFVGNPPQKIQLSACLKDFATFIISKDADGFNGGIYNKNDSDSYISLSNKVVSYFFQTFSEGINSRDIFKIEKSKTEFIDIEFILATKIGGNSCFESLSEFIPQPGILGFRLAQTIYFDENITNTNFISQLKQKNLISDYDFNFHFNTENSGNIIIGLKPHEYDKKHYNKDNYFFTKTSINDDLDWSLTFDKIYYDKVELPNEKPLLLRIEYGFINGYYQWEKIIQNIFFGELIEQKKCFRNYTHELGSTIYFFHCNKTVDISKFKPITFFINEFNYNFTLTYEDLFEDIGDHYLFLMTFGGISDLILGYPFLKKYQMIFNQDRKTIGFYKDTKKSKKSSSSLISYYIVIIVLGTILFGLIIIAIIFYIKKTKNVKKLATELLNDENEYHNEREYEKNNSIDSLNNNDNKIN